MVRLSLILVLAAACGGSSKPVQLAPLPEDPKQASAPPPAEVKPAEPAPPAAPPPAPVEAKIAATQTTVKLVSGGRGKKEALRYTPKAGGKQALELTLDFAGKRESAEGSAPTTVPTIVLTAEAETTAVDGAGAADFRVKVTGTDAREVANASLPLDQFKTLIGALSGLTIGGKREANGSTGEITLHLDNVPPSAGETLELIRLTLPQVPVLPSEALGVGAKWRATTQAKVADQIDVTQVTDYEVVSHTGSTWTIKGKTKVSGKDQTVENGKISAITGTGTSETTIADGALYPAHKAALETTFKATAGDKSLTFSLKVGSAVQPK